MASIITCLAVASNVRFDYSVNVSSVPVFGDTFFQQLYLRNIYYRSVGLLSDNDYLPGAWFVYNTFFFTLVQAYRYSTLSATGRSKWSCLLVSLLLPLSGDIESNPEPAQPTNFIFSCLEVRGICKKCYKDVWTMLKQELGQEYARWNKNFFKVF